MQRRCKNRQVCCQAERTAVNLGKPNRVDIDRYVSCCQPHMQTHVLRRCVPYGLKRMRWEIYAANHAKVGACSPYGEYDSMKPGSHTQEFGHSLRVAGRCVMAVSLPETIGRTVGKRPRAAVAHSEQVGTSVLNWKHWGAPPPVAEKTTPSTPPGQQAAHRTTHPFGTSPNA